MIANWPVSTIGIEIEGQELQERQSGCINKDFFVYKRLSNMNEKSVLDSLILNCGHLTRQTGSIILYPIGLNELINQNYYYFSLSYFSY